jgi:hypothetical protein
VACDYCTPGDTHCPICAPLRSRKVYRYSIGGYEGDQLQPIVRAILNDADAHPLRREPLRELVEALSKHLTIWDERQGERDALREAAQAALLYDAAIHRRGFMGDTQANDGEREHYATGDDLDALYMDWMVKTRAALHTGERTDSSQPIGDTASDRSQPIERCEGRYPVPQTAPPRDEPFEVTYRCALPKGHSGPHGLEALHTGEAALQPSKEEK